MPQGRRTDTDRVMRLLGGSNGLSNATVRSELGLSDARYGEIKSQLLEQAWIEKYRCRGGGIRLTPFGEKNVPVDAQSPDSTVDAEKDLYNPFIEYLEGQSEEDENPSLVVNTANLRTKGKWQNPDVTQVAIESYPFLGRTDVIVKTYEVKQWSGWDVDVVFESASHKRFSHEASVVLEWPNGAYFSLSDSTYKLDQISRECRRFGVGLYTLRPYYSSYRLHSHLDPIRHFPSNSSVESWLEYVFERRNKALARFNKLTGRSDA